MNKIETHVCLGTQNPHELTLQNALQKKTIAVSQLMAEKAFPISRKPKS
jgi:hypothetical protein